MPGVSVPELPAPLHHDVDLVPGVWRLGIGAAWRVQLHAEGAVLEQLDVALAVRARQAGQCFGDGQPVLDHGRMTPFAALRVTSLTA